MGRGTGRKGWARGFRAGAGGKPLAGSGGPWAGTREGVSEPGLGAGPAPPAFLTPAPCHPPTGCCHTGWAAGRPRAARRRSTGPAARPRGPGLQRRGPPLRPCCWSRGLPQPQCCWPPHQGRWLRAQEPGLHRRPEAAAGPGLRGRPRPAGPSGHPVGPPGAPAAAVGVVAAAGWQSHWGRPGPAEGKQGEWADAGPGRVQGLGAALQGWLRPAWNREDTRRRHRGRAGEQPGGQGAPTRDGETGWTEGPGQGTQGQPSTAPGPGALARRPRPRPGARYAGWLAGRPHLLGDLGRIQLVPELSSQLREAVGTRHSLPSADRIPVTLQRCLLTPGHSKDPAQLPGAWHARELLQEGRSQQQLLGAGCRGTAEKAPQTRGHQRPGPDSPEPHPAPPSGPGLRPPRSCNSR